VAYVIFGYAASLLLLFLYSIAEVLRWGKQWVPQPPRPPDGDLQKCLDDLERLLLERDWSPPDLEEPVPQWPDEYILCFFRVARMVPLRAALRGEPEKALVLLERYLEVNRIWDCRVFNSGRYVVGGVDESLIVDLGQIPEFPAEALAQAIKIVESMALNAKLREDLNAAWAFRFKRSLLEPGFARSHEPRSAWLRGMGGGVVDAQVRRLLWPVWCMEFDRYSQFRKSGTNYEAWENTTNRLRLLEKYMNIAEQPVSGSTGQSSLLVEYSSRLGHEEENSDELDKARVIMAAALFQREQGRWPQSAQELVPKYLEGNGPGLQEGAWRFYVLPEFDCPGLSDLPPKAPFRAAVEAYFREAHRKYKNEIEIPLPTLEDLRPYARDEKELGDFAKRFVRIPQKSLLCRFCLTRKGDDPNPRGRFLYLSAQVRVIEGIVSREELVEVLGIAKGKGETINAK
jgi:hypothetical protein